MRSRGSTDRGAESGIDGGEKRLRRQMLLSGADEARRRESDPYPRIIEQMSLLLERCRGRLDGQQEEGGAGDADVGGERHGISPLETRP